MRYTRALAIVTILSMTACSEWVPASVAEATGQQHVRVREQMSFSSQGDKVEVVATELEFPSHETLMRLKCEGARFQVRHANADRAVMPVVFAIFGAATLGALIAIALQNVPFGFPR